MSRPGIRKILFFEKMFVLEEFSVNKGFVFPGVTRHERQDKSFLKISEWEILTLPMVGCVIKISFIVAYGHQ